MMVMWDDSKDDNNERRHGNAHHRYYFLNPKSHNETKIEKLSETTKKKKDTSQKNCPKTCVLRQPHFLNIARYRYRRFISVGSRLHNYLILSLSQLDRRPRDYASTVFCGRYYRTIHR